MALWDDIQAVAQQKSSYKPGLAGVKRTDVNRALTSRSAPRFRVGPETRLPRVELPDIGQNVSVKRSDIWGYLDAAKPTPAEMEDGNPFDSGGWRGALKSGFSKVIDVVDTPRAAVVSAGEQLGKALSGQDASWDEFWADTARNQGTGQLIEEYAPDAPRWAKLAGGLAGDVVLDPLTWATFGTVKAGVGAAKGASALDNALIQGSRVGLSKEVVLQAAERGIVDEAVDRLAIEAGRRGRGAFTRKALARTGAEGLPEKLGLTVDFGYRLGTSRAGVRVPLTRTLAEASESLKGNLKAFGASTSAASKWRQLRVSSLMGERELTDQILTGAATSADAARGLAALKIAKGSSWRWLDETAAQVSRDMPELRHMSANDLSEITHAIERGEFVGMSEKIKTWYDQVGTYLKSQNVEFEWRDLYVNHTLSKKALAALKAGDHRLKAMGLDATEAFQHGRVMEGTIQDINARFRDQLGYNLLEDDVAVLMTRYLGQAQRSLLRAHASRVLQDLNVLRPMSEVVDVSKKQLAIDPLQAELDEAVAQESRWLQDANKERRKNLTSATKVVTERRTETALELQAVEAELDSAVKRLRDTERALTSSEGRLAALEVAERQWNAVAKRSRSAHKGAATRKLKQIQTERYNLLEQVGRLKTQIDSMSGQKGVVKLRADRDVLVRQHGEIAMQARELAEARKALDETPLGAGPALGEEELARSVERIRKVREEFINGVGEHVDAANAFVWATVDADTATSRLNKALVDFDRATEAIIDAPKVGKKPLSDVEFRREVRDELRQRTQVVQEVLRTMPDDPRVKALANIEAQTASWDMEALQWRVKAKDIQRQIDVLRDPKFIDHMTKVADDGFTAIGNDLQMPTWLDEAYDTAKRLKNVEDVTGLIRMLDAFNGWWKGWATASPGFVVRNWYSGVFNIWLDRGASAAKSMVEFRGFYKRYKTDPAKAVEWASQKYGKESAAHFEGALEAAAASGWGLTPQEVSSQLVGERRTINPFSTRNYIPGYIRDKSSDVEAILRGSHAYDIIKSGGSVSAATDQIEKFHFNYRDITDFDRAAKRVIPFWTFFSRNMALQSNVWTHMPHKLNRSYFNVKRNLEAQSDPDATVPSYFGEIGAIRTPIGERDGGAWYFTPDLPSLRFREDLTGALGVGDDGFDPLRLLTDAGPLVKTPVELAVNRQLFTDIPFKNRPYDFDAEGHAVPREAPLWAQIPGVDTALGALPGVRDVGGTMTMQDNTQYALESLWPLMGKATRLIPNQPKYEERQLQSTLSFAGVPVRQNTEQSIQGELYRQQNVSEKHRNQQALDQLLREIGG